MVIHYLQCGVVSAILPNLTALYRDFFHWTRPLSSLSYNDQLPQPVPSRRRCPALSLTDKAV